MGDGRSLAETPTWSVATVTTVMVAVCFVVERSIYRFGKWLRKTKRKAMLAALEKIREELMLLGLISLMLSQTARWISDICVPSSLFSSRFYICSEADFDDLLAATDGSSDQNRSAVVITGDPLLEAPANHCQEGYEPFVSFEGLEQLHRFLFILGITHVLYSFVTVVLSMIKIYSWRKWEIQAYPLFTEDLQARRRNMMKRQSTFVFHHASHPWSKNKILIWMGLEMLVLYTDSKPAVYSNYLDMLGLFLCCYELCFIRQFKGSIAKSDYLALRLGFITNHKLPLSYNFHKYMVRSMEDEFYRSVGISWPLWAYAILCILVNIHGVNIYFWLSFIPAILAMLVGTKLEQVVAQLALDVAGATDPCIGTQLKPRDDLFWFGKPEILLWLIQFISFQNAFEMATFIWSLWDLSSQSCFMNNHYMIVIRLISGLLVQFWCSYSTLPLNVIISQMGSKFKKSLLAERVRESLHSWCRRVKEKSQRDPMLYRAGTITSTCSLGSTIEEKSKRDPMLYRTGTITSTCSLGSTIDETDETNTIESGTLSRCSSRASLEELVLDNSDEPRHHTTTPHL